MTAQPYLLDNSTEHNRLSLQVRVWEPHAREMLDLIRVQPGWHCADIGCGALGILEPLAQRVGSSGRVIGTEIHESFVEAARRFVSERGLSNVEIIHDDAYASRVGDASLDFAHVRFVFAPCGRERQLLSELIRIVKPGGIIAIQEPDAARWRTWPYDATWERLKNVILRAFKLGGGDFDAGTRLRSMLLGAGLQNVQARAVSLTIDGGHPYKRLPVLFAQSLRRRILDAHLMSEDELVAAIAHVERIAADPSTVMTSFVVMQAWARRPA
jgi:ubiquinone/menaquinone biosynthesis C-methylase UbiE